LDVFSLKDVIAVCRIFPRRKLLLKATFVTFFRVLLVFITVALFDRGVTFNAIATCLIACIIAMDGLDGYIARKYGETSRQGAVFDILGDRIVENVLWIYFACIGEFPFWIPVTVITRDVVVDNIRSLWRNNHAKGDVGKVPCKFKLEQGFVRRCQGCLLYLHWPADYFGKCQRLGTLVRLPGAYKVHTCIHHRGLLYTQGTACCLGGSRIPLQQRKINILRLHDKSCHL